jgi:hypothetical protein
MIFKIAVTIVFRMPLIENSMFLPKPLQIYVYIYSIFVVIPNKKMSGRYSACIETNRIDETIPYSKVDIVNNVHPDRMDLYLYSKFSLSYI